jgi:phosphate-selective porin
MITRFENGSQNADRTVATPAAPSRRRVVRLSATAAASVRYRRSWSAALVAALVAFAAPAYAGQTDARAALVTSPTVAGAGVSAAASSTTTTTTAAVPAQRDGQVARQDQGTARWNDRPAFQFGDGVRLEFRARMQSDLWLRDDTNPDATDATFRERLSFPRRRVGVVGEIGTRVEFQAEREISGVEPWRDVYADVRVAPSLWVRAGHFKVPFSLEQLTSVYDLDFASRAAAVADLAPTREVGVMAHGRVAARALEYEVGAFRSDRSARVWQSGAARSLAGRLMVAPLRDGRHRGARHLQLAASMLLGESAEGRTGVNGHLAMGDVFFERMFVNGPRRRLGLSAEWTAGAASVQGEWIHGNDARLGQAIDGSDLSDLVSRGGYASLTVRALDRKNKLGDLDLGVRFDRLVFGSTDRTDEPFLHPRADHVAPIGRNAWTFGATLYATRWVKVQANAVREQVTDPLGLHRLGTTRLWSTVARAQISM